jgi:hypothetical protein
VAIEDVTSRWQFASLRFGFQSAGILWGTPQRNCLPKVKVLAIMTNVISLSFI